MTRRARRATIREMQNLAGRPDSTYHCRDELLAAGVPVVFLDEPHGEPQSQVGGQLGPYEFRRLWYYWAVRGRVPIEAARRLYADPAGRHDVRAAGHCACPPPDDEAKWYDAEGRHLVYDPQGKQEAQWRELVERHPDWLEDPEETVFVREHPSTVPGAHGYVESYHVDTAEGLALLVRVLGEVISGSRPASPATET